VSQGYRRLIKYAFSAQHVFEDVVAWSMRPGLCAKAVHANESRRIAKVDDSGGAGANPSY
jgi:hypothetical protein